MPPGLPPIADLAVYLHHITNSTQCTCILCNTTSFNTLITQLQQHKRRRIQQLQNTQTETLSYLPYACLHIDASLTDWANAVKTATLASLFNTAAQSQQQQQRRQQVEESIAQLVQQQEKQHEEYRDRDGTGHLLFAPPPPSLSVIPALSVRSALSLYLTVRAYPSGSTVLLTAVTIPDMLSVLRYHQLLPIPVDIDILTLAPSCAEIESKCRKNTVALLVAHLYGKQMEMTDIINTCRQLQIEVWEDLAEGYRGFTADTTYDTRRQRQEEENHKRQTQHQYTDPYAPSVSSIPAAQAVSHSSSSSSSSSSPSSNVTPPSIASNRFFAPYPLGHPDADLALFSFGSIKSNTAFGAGLLLLPSRHADIATKIIDLQHSLPIQSSTTYLHKCIRILLGMAVLNVPLCSGLIMTSARIFGIDHKSMVVSLLRGFTTSAQLNSFMAALHQQPALPLLQQFLYRLQHYAVQETIRNTMMAEVLIALLPQCAVVPGKQAYSTHYWLFPILTPTCFDSTAAVLQQLNRYGIDAYQGATQLAFVSPTERDQLPCFQAKEMMERMVYLPVHKNVPLSAIVEMAAIVEWVCEKAEAQRHCNGSQAQSQQQQQPVIRSKL